jgi:hypothetical protein
MKHKVSTKMKNIFAVLFLTLSVSSGLFAQGTQTRPMVVVGPGTAGTPSGGVESVQGVAGGQPVITNNNYSNGTGMLPSDVASTNATQLAGNTLVNNPCETVAGTTTAISIATSSVIITATAAKKTYICGILLSSSDAAGETVNVVEGTGTLCASSQVALIGSTTAANGVLLGASGGGFGFDIGKAPIINGKTVALDICIIQVASHRVSGFVTWVQQGLVDPRHWLLSILAACSLLWYRRRRKLA